MARVILWIAGVLITLVLSIPAVGWVEISRFERAVDAGDGAMLASMFHEEAVRAALAVDLRAALLSPRREDMLLGMATGPVTQVAVETLRDLLNDASGWVAGFASAGSLASRVIGATRAGPGRQAVAWRRSVHGLSRVEWRRDPQGARWADPVVVRLERVGLWTWKITRVEVWPLSQAREAGGGHE